MNIPEFFQDFPEVEEDAINAVYDLCEDQSGQVGDSEVTRMLILFRSYRFEWRAIEPLQVYQR